jgi:hypothetical protein
MLSPQQRGSHLPRHLHRVEPIAALLMEQPDAPFSPVSKVEEYAGARALKSSHNVFKS